MGDGVRAAREFGWDPFVISTDAALPWLEGQELADAPALTGDRKPGDPRRTPEADAVAVVPMTFNTLNAWADGRADTYPLTILCAALGSKTPGVAVPFASMILQDILQGWRLSQYSALRVDMLDPHDGSAVSLRPVGSGTAAEVSRQFVVAWGRRKVVVVPHVDAGRYLEEGAERGRITEGEINALFSVQRH